MYNQAQVVHVDGNLEEVDSGMVRRLTSTGNIRNSMSSSLKILTISSTKQALLAHLSPMFWWFMRCRGHTATCNLFMSMTSFITTIGFGYQCSFFPSMHLSGEKQKTNTIVIWTSSCTTHTNYISCSCVYYCSIKKNGKGGIRPTHHLIREYVHLVGHPRTLLDTHSNYPIWWLTTDNYSQSHLKRAISDQ